MVTFRKLEDSIVGVFFGQPFTAQKTSEVESYLAKEETKKMSSEEFLKGLRELEPSIIETSCKFIKHNKITGELFLKDSDGNLFKEPLPEYVAESISRRVEADLDVLPYIKAYARLLTNPRVTSEMIQYFDKYLQAEYVDEVLMNSLIEDEGYTEDVARNLSTYKDISITVEGMLATYKVAELVNMKWEMQEQEDGTFNKVYVPRYARIPAVVDDITGEEISPEKFDLPKTAEELIFTPAIHKSGEKFLSAGVLGYKYKVGEEQRLPFEATRNLTNTFGGGGLYSGGLNYINHYGSDYTETLLCLIDPANLLSFQCEGGALRTDALFPTGIWDNKYPCKSEYHSSEYAKLSEENLETLIKTAIDKEVNLKEYTGEAESEEDSISCKGSISKLYIDTDETSINCRREC